jgi:hypothetical protein
MDIKDIAPVATTISAIVAVTYALIRVLGWLSKTREKRRDSERIFEFLNRSEEDGEWKWQTTQAIQKATDIPPERIVELASRDKRIEKSDKRRDMWRINGKQDKEINTSTSKQNNRETAILKKEIPQDNATPVRDSTVTRTGIENTSVAPSIKEDITSKAPNAETIAKQVKQLIKSDDDMGLDDLLRPLATHISKELASDRFPDFGKAIPAQDIESRLEQYSTLTDPLTFAMATGCRWAKEPLRIWKDCVEIITQPAQLNTILRDGRIISRSLRLYPGLMTFYAAGMGALIAERYDTLRFLFHKPKVPFYTFSEELSDWREPAVALTPWEILARRKNYSISGNGKYFDLKAALSLFLFDRLKSHIVPLLNSAQDYSGLFDDFEYLLGLCNFTLIQDGVENRDESDANVGRFAIRSDVLRFLELKKSELNQKRDEWPPLKSDIVSGPFITCKGMMLLYNKEVELFYGNRRHRGNRDLD